MQTLEILIEENAFGGVRPVQMVADAPVSALLPALVTELQLPRTDIFGNPLRYVLRDAISGSVLPEHLTLRQAGVIPGARLALDSYALNGSAPMLMQQAQIQYAVSNAAPTFAQPTMQPTVPPPFVSPALMADRNFHASATITDQDQLPAVGRVGRRDTTNSLPPLYPTRKKGSWTRRAFLLGGGAVLGAGVAGVGYAAYSGKLPHLLQSLKQLQHTQTTTQHTTNPPVKAQPTQAPLPTNAKQIFTFTGHQAPVRVVAWSPDGTQVASGANDAHLMTWNLQGNVYLNIHHDTTVRALAWRPDNQRIVTGDGTHITFFNAQTGKRLAHFTHEHTNDVTSLAWATHGQMQVVSGSLDEHAVVWDGITYQPTLVFRLHTAGIEAVTWANDGQAVASSSLGGVTRVWNAQSGQELHGLYLDGQISKRAAAFSPVSTMLAIGGDDGIIRLWNNGLVCQQQGVGMFGQQCMDMPQHLQLGNTAIQSLAWSPDGRFLLSGSDDGTFAVWYPAKNQQPLFSMHLTNPILSVSWSPTNAQQIAVASGNSVSVWQVV